MSIERVEVFVTRGQQFPTVRKALDYREGLIEAFLRALPGFQDMPAKQKIPFVQAVLDRRDELAELLDYSAPACDR